MHGPGAPEGEQHEVAQVVPAHGRDRLDGLFHLDLDDPHDAFGGYDRIDAERLRDLRGDRLAGAGEVEAHLAAEEIVLAQMPHDQIAVRDGRHLAAAAVAGRPGHGAGALRADLQHAETVDPGDGPAAGADRVDVHHGQCEVAPLDLAAAGDEGSPSRISATSQEVPPMSKVMMFWKPVMRHA